MIENELSFLVAWLPELGGAAKKEIEQHYLSDEKTPLRLRATGGEHFELTKKLPVAGGDLSRMEEITVPLSRTEYAMLVPHAVRSLRKTRYLVPLQTGLTAEVDVFHGPLEGLVMAEVEFRDEAARAAFTPPPWFGRDVSQEEWAMNSWLAGKSFEDVKEYVTRRPSANP